MDKAKPFCIPKRLVWEPYKRVKANRGADYQSIEEFEKDVKNNLYKLWNPLSSDSYFPPPVKRVEIKKRDGGMRPTYYGCYYKSALYPTTPFEPMLSALGHGEVQTPEKASSAGRAPCSRHYAPRPGTVRALAVVVSGGGWTVRAG